MGKKKYIKNSNGVTMSVTTDTLGLEKPLLNENYDIDVHNRNMDKIDEDLKPIDDSYIIELFQHDGDTTNPRDYYTKVEADEKFASKEDLNNIDLSNLATKEEANNALNKANEAFQRGDNVKTQLVDKLISEGLEVSTNNTFEELIGNIALGKKFAKGESVSPQVKQSFTSLGNNTTANFLYIQIPKLDFTPTLIVYICKTHLGGCGFLCDLKQINPHTASYITAIAGQPSTSDSVGVYSLKANSSVYLSDGSIRLPVFIQGATFSWVAVE